MAGTPSSSRVAASIVHQAVTTLTNAQVLTLPTTPVTIVADPGAGRALLPTFAALRLVWTADYTNIDAGAATLTLGQPLRVLGQLRNNTFNGVTDLLAPGDSVAAVILPQQGVRTDAATSDASAGLSGLYDADMDGALTLAASNGALGNFTGGNAANVLRVTVSYLEYEVATGTLLEAA